MRFVIDPSSSVLMRAKTAAAVALMLAIAGPAVAAGTDAKGTIVYKGKTANVKYAYLVQGPDAISKKPIKRLILSTTDLGAKIAACKKMSCTDSDLGDGMSVNIEGGDRLNFWLVQNDQKVQYSGTEPAASLAAKVNDGKRMAGTLRFDKTASGGPKVDVEFDAAMAKETSAP